LQQVDDEVLLIASKSLLKIGVSKSEIAEIRQKVIDRMGQDNYPFAPVVLVPPEELGKKPAPKKRWPTIFRRLFGN
jgi:hypothetical protein